MGRTVDLDREEIQSILSLYHIDDLGEFGLVRSELFNTLYWVQALKERFFLRVGLRRRFSDMVFEKDFLGYLKNSDLPIPRLVENVASGAFTPWSSRGRYVSLYQFVDGRILGLFQLESAHSAQIGDFLGRLHGLGEDFAPRKSRRNFMEELEKDFDRLERAASSGKMKATLAGELAGLRVEFEAQCSRSMNGSAGLHHGGLVLRNALFRRGKLTLVRDFSRAGHGRFTMDLAIAINAWCWDASARQRGGPAGLYSPTRMEALLAAYTQRRPLTKTDYIALTDDLRLSAVAGAIYRLVHYEMRASSDGLYEDFRHFTAKLEALAENRANELLEMAKPKRE